MDKVKQHFNNESQVYDDFIVKIIPKYKEMTEVLLKMLPFENDRELKIIDLGIGTGNLAFHILNKYPKAQILGIDIAEQMLKQAGEKLYEYKNRLELRRLDIRSFEVAGSYDAIVSGLAIHHLNSEEKKELYGRIYKLLKPGGCFINRDVVKGPGDRLESLYEKIWCSHMEKRVGKTKANFYFGKHKEEDLPDTLQNQLKWLQEAGFKEVDCYFKYYNYAVFGGIR